MPRKKDGGQRDRMQQYPQILKDIIGKGALVLVQRMAMPPEKARVAATYIAEMIRKDWSGDQIYISKGQAFDTFARDLEMFNKFTGKNYAELAKEYGISVRQVYDRLAIVRAEGQQGKDRLSAKAV